MPGSPPRYRRPNSVDKRAVIARGQGYRPSEQTQVVVSPELDGRQPESAGVYELAHPRPCAVIEAHEIAAVHPVLAAVDKLPAIQQSGNIGNGKRPPESLGEAVRLVARIGGYLGRKNDAPPGHQIIWQGYIALRFMSLGFALSDE